MNKCAKHDEAGFTLLEVLLAVVILSLVILPFFGFFTQALLFSNKNEQELVAINKAREALAIVQQEHLSDEDFQGKQLSWDALSMSTTITSTTQPTVGEIIDASGKKYYITAEKGSAHPTGLQALIIKVFSSATVTTDSLLTQTFGYVKDGDSP